MKLLKIHSKYICYFSYNLYIKIKFKFICLLSNISHNVNLSFFNY